MEEPNDPSKVFSFEAYDDSDDSPATIDVVSLGSGLTSGTIRVLIDADPSSSRTYGALNLGQLDIKKTGVTGILTGLNISGSLATDGAITIHSSYSGTLFVNRRFNGNISIEGDLTGTVTLHIARNPDDEAGTDGATHVGASDRDIANNRDYAATAIVCDDAQRALFARLRASGSRHAPSL